VRARGFAPTIAVLLVAAVSCTSSEGPLRALAAPPPGEAGSGPPERIRKRGELRWGGDIQGGEPYVFEGEGGKLVGFEVEIADAIARRLGVKARFVQVAWSSLVPALERGDYDIAMNGLELTRDRAERLRLSKPYYVYSETLAVRKGDPIRFLDLSGRRVGTLNQTYAHQLLERIGADVALYEGVQEPYMDLVAGRLDAVLLDNVIADAYGCPLPEVDCVKGDAALGGYVIGVRKDEADLQRAIDESLAAMKADGELRRILERWKLWDGRQEGPPPGVGASRTRERHSFEWRHARLFLEGALTTLWLSVASFALAVLLGLGLAVARVTGGPVTRAAATAYVEIFRGTPVLLQLYVLYFTLAPVLRLGAFSAAVVGLALNYAAYEAEIYRGAIQSIPRGQTEAASALGLSTWQTLRHVILPQALRMGLPAMTNDFVALLKDSSVVGVITVVELTKRMTIAAVDLNDWVVPGLACAALYFMMSFPLSQLARRLEKKLHVDARPAHV
jgi:polar amino acid transport system substrate-binding protein